MSCVVTAASWSLLPSAKVVAKTLALPFVEDIDALDSGVALVVDIDCSWLQRLQAPRLGPVHVDFASADMLHRRKAGHNEPLGRAIGVKDNFCPRVFDATAGLGRDAFVMADLGCFVALSEASRPLNYLLREAVARALISSNIKVVQAANRMQVMTGDSAHHEVEGFDVIYIDPMFPERSKSAAVKKDLATIQALQSDDCDYADAESLLAWAYRQAVDRVVVKRPAKARPLSAAKPSHSIVGKTVRFDVIVKPKSAVV